MNIELWQVLLGTYIRYFLFSGIAYLLFYVWKRRTGRLPKIQFGYPKPADIDHEIQYSLITIVIFALVIYTFVFSPLRAHSRIYDDFHEHSTLYFIFSILACILIHDTYFYWTHRFMHWNRIFPYVHHIHHKSHNPTPWAAFAFHPVEAVIEVGVLPIIVFIVPVHPLALAFFGLFMTIMNVLGHLGYELFPKRFINNPWLVTLLNTSTHHNMHHHYGKKNYGLYFNIWDTLLGTNHKHYEVEFRRITAPNDEPVVVHEEKPVVQ